MKLLFVCDDYPPFEGGGFAQLCFDAAQSLRSRKHLVKILCLASRGDQHSEDEQHVIRRLKSPVRFEDQWPVPVQQVFLAKSRTQANVAVFHEILNKVRPDVIVIWPNIYLDKAVMVEAETNSGVPIVYYVAGVSPTDPSPLEIYWAKPGTSASARIAKSMLRPFLGSWSIVPPELALSHVICVSAYERKRVIDTGVRSENATVIHNGIDPEQFRFLGLPSTRRQSDAELRILYVGRLVHNKGCHTLVEAVSLLTRKHPEVSCCLTIVGAGPDAYVQELNTLVDSAQIRDRVVFRPWVSRVQMPNLIGGSDVLVLPTIGAEPMARVVQEAMATGLLVVATATGGTSEIVQNGITGLTFEAGDHQSLAVCLERLCLDLQLCDRLTVNARDLVRKNFTIDLMTDKFERYVQQWADQRDLT